MTQSKKHHYLPRFYLKGFTNGEGNYFIYDKHKDEIRKSNPDNSFFEKYRNSGIVGDEKSDIPEQILSHFDDRTATVLEIIRKSDYRDNVLTPENLYIIRFFISTTFWRIPKNDKLREKIIDEYSFKELGFGLYNKNTGERMIDTENLVRDIDLFRKIYPSILSLTSFINKYKTNNFDDWMIIHRTNSSHITCDNPIILEKGFSDFSSIQQNLLIPLSSKKVLVCTQKNVPKSFPPDFNLLMDMIILHQSERYVCSSNEKYLRLIVGNLYKMSCGKDWLTNMKEDLFHFFN